ncbi:MAG: BlaI/MecI/CopY family transcriptional regulator [Streptomyces sp.]|nr:BlaI/MecI/CopY family transcriptional regulator [Streptomyces sp.]
MGNDPLERALALLGPLESRIMRAVWTRTAAQEFVVRDMLALMPELAYTTVMTTLRRLAEKGLLTAHAEVGTKAYVYRSAGSPEDYLTMASRRDAAEAVDKYGDAALAAFAARLDELTEGQRERLGKLLK